MKRSYRLGAAGLLAACVSALCFVSASQAAPNKPHGPNLPAASPNVSSLPPAVQESTFVVLQPCRIVDTRVVGGKLTAGHSRAFYVCAARQGSPPRAARAAAAVCPRRQARSPSRSPRRSPRHQLGKLTALPDRHHNAQLHVAVPSRVGKPDHQHGRQARKRHRPGAQHRRRRRQHALRHRCRGLLRAPQIGDGVGPAASISAGGWGLWRSTAPPALRPRQPFSCLVLPTRTLPTGVPCERPPFNPPHQQAFSFPAWGTAPPPHVNPSLSPRSPPRRPGLG